MSISPIPAGHVRCGLYARISRDDEGDLLGVGRQEKDARALATRKGWEVVEVYVDDDLSAWSGKRRPSYLRMLDAIESGRINAVIAYDLDRLHRLPKELEHFFEVCDRAGVKNLATVAGDINLASSDGQFHARMMGAVAKKSSDDTSRRLKRRYDEDAEAGTPHGPRAFGYKADRVSIDPIEAAIVREMVDRLFASEPLNAIARQLNESGVLGPQGGKGWAGTTVRSVLSNPRLAGLRVHRGVVAGAAAWPGIIDRATHERIVAYFADPKRRQLHTPKRRLLTGLAVCGRCDGRLTYRGRSGAGPGTIYCAKAPGRQNCGGLSASSAPVERIVLEALFARLSEASLTRKPETGDSALDEVATLGSRMTELAEMFAAGEIRRDEWVKARGGIDARLTAARRTLASSTRSAAAVDALGPPRALRAEWDGLSIDRQRLILGSMIEQVIVRPTDRRGAKFDTERVDITWRE